MIHFDPRRFGLFAERIGNTPQGRRKVCIGNPGDEQFIPLPGETGDRQSPDTGLAPKAALPWQVGQGKRLDMPVIRIMDGDRTVGRCQSKQDPAADFRRHDRASCMFLPGQRRCPHAPRPSLGQSLVESDKIESSRLAGTPRLGQIEHMQRPASPVGEDQPAVRSHRHGADRFHLGRLARVYDGRRNKRGGYAGSGDKRAPIKVWHLQFPVLMLAIYRPILWLRCGA